MSPNIEIEARLLLLSAASGAGLSLLYGALRLWRRLVPHGWLWTGLEDFAYWVFAGFAVFYLLYRENDGVLRLYVVGTVLLTMAACDRLGRSIFTKVLKRRRRCFKMKGRAGDRTPGCR